MVDAPPKGSSRLLILGLLCTPNLVAVGALALDNLMRQLFGSELSTWGFLGGLVGLGGLLSGLISILLWPAVAFLTFRSVRSRSLRPVGALLVAGGCLVATYSAAYFAVWFVVIPLLHAGQG